MGATGGMLVAPPAVRQTAIARVFQIQDLPSVIALLFPKGRRHAITVLGLARPQELAAVFFITVALYMVFAATIWHITRQ